VSTRFSLVLLIAALSACATPRAEKVSFEDAFRRTKGGDAEDAPKEAQRAPAPEKKEAPGDLEVPPAARSSMELQGALVSFAARARKYRATTPRGTGMPGPEVANWLGLLDATDAFLARNAKDTSSYDVIRARFTMEAEMDLDARTYATVPQALFEDVMERITAFGVRMAELRRLQIKTQEVASAYVWPVEPVAITSLFGRRLHPIAHVFRPHLGVDLAASIRQEVFAAAAGTVIRAEWSGAHGKQVEILHPGNITTRYSHLSDILVDAGTVLKKGDTVGLAGSTGASTGVHLHFEFWRNGKACDPLEELGPPGSPRRRERVAVR
jgi:murein DD-endopeptidase MepM/ murein hydrolase activator NlpD